MNTKEEKFKELLEKILPYGKLEKESKISNVLLFKEFWRRHLLWLNEFQGYPSPEGTLNQWNLLLRIMPELKKDLKPIDSFMNEFGKTGFHDKGFFNKDFLFVYLFIYWEIYKDSDELKEFNHLPHPYETTIQILKRGGGIRFLRSRFMINNIEVNLKKMLNEPLPSLDNDFLDFIDKCCGNSSINIPNSQEIALLWREYNGGNQLYQKRHPKY